MNSVEHPLKRGTLSMYGKYKVCEICNEETTNFEDTKVFLKTYTQLKSHDVQQSE